MVFEIKSASELIGLATTISVEGDAGALRTEILVNSDEWRWLTRAGSITDSTRDEYEYTSDVDIVGAYFHSSDGEVAADTISLYRELADQQIKDYLDATPAQRLINVYDPTQISLTVELELSGGDTLKLTYNRVASAIGATHKALKQMGIKEVHEYPAQLGELLKDETELLLIAERLPLLDDVTANFLKSGADDVQCVETADVALLRVTDIAGKLDQNAYNWLYGAGCFVVSKVGE